MEHHTFKYSGSFSLESGEKLPELTLAYTTLGTPGKKVVWICHALTANAEAESWWSGLVGEGKLYNPDEYYIICVNILGSCYGSTSPASVNPETGEPWFWNFPAFTIRDIVNGLDLLRQELKIDEIHTCVGGSLGGQQALEWSVMKPDFIRNMIVLASNAFHSPWGVAFNESQRMAIKADPTWKENRIDAGKEGLKAARAIALLSYRNYITYFRTQNEDSAEKLDDFRATSYQNYQGEKLVKRFNCHSYWYLSKAMDSHNVGRGRGGVEKALSKVRANALLIGIKSDILFPVSEQRLIADNIENAVLSEMDSMYGHDGFLIECEKIQRFITDFYNLKA